VIDPLLTPHQSLKCELWQNKQMTEIFVTTGSFTVGSKKGILNSGPLGSCIACIAYDSTAKIGGLAHIMLPGKFPENGKKENENRYTENIITNLLAELEKLGSTKATLKICLVGGANVLKRKDNNIANEVVESVLKTIKKKELTLKKTSLGGYERRVVTIDINTGIVSASIGDSRRKLFFTY